MRKRLFSALVVSVCTLSFTLPASATIHFEFVDMTADCTHYEIHVTGTTTTTVAVEYLACYVFSIEDEIVAEGCAAVTIPPNSSVNLVINEPWTALPCGAFTVTGGISLVPAKSTHPYFEFEFEPADLDCPCECEASLDAELIADCDGYAIKVTGSTEVVYRATYAISIGDEIVAQGTDEEIAANPAVDCILAGLWIVPPCGVFTVTGELSLTPPQGSSCPPFDFVFAPIDLDCPCDYDSPGTGTPGYWKNHPEAWPVEAEYLEVGCVVYTQADAVALMWEAGGNDKLHTMFNALVAAKLNVLIGNDPTCIADTIDAADVWMCVYGPIGEAIVTAGGKASPWRSGEPLYETLDAYNNGLLCAPSRDAMEAEE